MIRKIVLLLSCLFGGANGLVKSFDITLGGEEELTRSGVITPLVEHFARRHSCSCFFFFFPRNMFFIALPVP